MFNFKNSNSGKIRVKLLATLLVLTLTFANFALVGSYIGEAIAAEIDLSKQDNSTNNDNVKFELYFAENNSNIISKDMNANDLVLNAKVSVKNAGVLENAKLEFSDTSFELKEDISLEIGTIQAGGDRELTLPIQMKKDGNTFNLRLLDMMSKITLTGSYKTEDGIENINTTKYVQVNWTSDAIAETSEEEKPIELTQELITNKIYNIQGIDKRVVQYKITSGITNNQYPIKSTTIELQLPIVEENVPEVVVAAYLLNATNPNERLNFKEYDEENPNNAYYTYNQEEGKVNINITNNENESNEITWNKQGKDEFVVTYIYPADVEITEITSVINSEITLHDLEDSVLSKTNTLGKTDIQELSNIVSLETSAQDIYKGNMYIGEDTDYETTSKIYVSYSQIADGIIYTETSNEFPEGMSSYYTTTKINKADAKKVLGAEGTITIIATPDIITEESMPTTQIIDLAVEEESDYYIINHENNISQISIGLGNIETEGTIEIINERIIRTEDTTIVQELKEVKVNERLQLVNTTENEEETTTEILETITDTYLLNLLDSSYGVEFSVRGINEATKLATAQENNVYFTIELKTDDIKYKLYNEPEIVITLPEIVEKIEDIDVVMMNKNALEIESAVPENNTIKVKLSGKQESYTDLNEQISINAKITTNKLIPTVDRDINMQLTNGEDIINKSQTVTFESDSGILLATSVLNFNSENATITSFGEEIATGILTENVEARTATVIGTVINNTKSDLDEIIIFGKVQNDGASINTALNSEVLVQNKIGENTNLETEVYYTEDANPTIESNWTNAATANTTAYHIVCKNVEKASAIEFGYNILIPENLETNKETLVDYIVYYNSEEKKAPEVKLQTPKEVKLDLELTANVENEAEVYEGQAITYNIKLTNSGDVDAENVKLDLVADGLTIVEGQNVVEGLSIKVGETYEEEIKAIVNKDIATTSFVAEATTEYLIEKEKAKGTITNTVSKAGLELKIDKTIYTYSEKVEIAQIGSLIKYKLEVINTSDEDLDSIQIINKLPEELESNELYAYKEFGEEITELDLQDVYNYDEETKEMNIEIDSLKAGEKALISIHANVEKVIDSDIFNSVYVKANEKYPDTVFNITDTTDVKGLPIITSSVTSSVEGNLNAGDIIEYTIKVRNDGETAERITIESVIPEQLDLLSAVYYYIQGEEKNPAINSNEVSLYLMDLEQNEEITVKIIAKANEIMSDTNIENLVTITGTYIQEITDKVENVVIGTGKNPSDDQNPDNNPTDDPTDDPNNNPSDNPSDDSGNNPGDQESTYSITGIAWQDENKNGEREDEEKLLSGIGVKILNIETNEFLSDENGNIIELTTSENGVYEFTNLKPGKYIVIYEYNKTTYSPAAYQKTGVDSKVNSDARLVTEENINITKTDILEIKNQNISNIDIGLILNPIFDLKLDKYITKVSVQNSSGTKVYEYDKTQLAKVEIPAKVLDGSLVIVEYQIDITNEGDIPAHVDSIVDYVSPQFEFKSELNTEWYKASDNNLYCIEFANENLEPGETVSTKLILTKTMTNTNTGLVNNAAEIYETFNEYAYEDIDSKPANMEQEDDLSEADLIISIKTGGPILYIGIVIMSMLILSAGIYLINKKVIKNHII